MPKSGRTAERGYGSPYRRARRALLADYPPCHWCGKPATTADHEPPMDVCGYAHLNLVPACKKCNYGRRNRAKARHFTPSRAW